MGAYPMGGKGTRAVRGMIIDFLFGFEIGLVFGHMGVPW
jgi:hypothetical protein